MAIEMKRIKSIDDNLDRLSALPDSLIHHIFSFLNMTDVVKTALLSKRWEYLWLTVPSLYFHDKYNDFVKFPDFVNRALKLWRGTYLEKFSFGCFNYICYKVPSDMDLWVRFATDRKVEKLGIRVHIGLRWESRKLYYPPQCLYECSSIRKLFLKGCNLLRCGNVQWNCLNYLELSRCLFSEDVLSQIVSSPQLETFLLRSLWECSNMSIRSSSLKNLSIDLKGQQFPQEPMVLTIWAPNLEALQLSTTPCKKCLLTDVSSLREVDLEFFSDGVADDGDALCQVLADIQHAVTINVSVDSFKMLGVMKGKYSFSHVKLLKIGGALTKVSELVCLVEIFPMLEMLIIVWNVVGELFKSDADNNIMSEANILKSNLLQLRRVKITWYPSNASIFQLLEFLLKHASAIEKIVIEKRKILFNVVDSEIIYRAAQKMVGLQRSFPSVELVLC